MKTEYVPTTDQQGNACFRVKGDFDCEQGFFVLGQGGFVHAEEWDESLEVQRDLCLEHPQIMALGGNQ